LLPPKPPLSLVALLFLHNCFLPMNDPTDIPEMNRRSEGQILRFWLRQNDDLMVAAPE
jgi:hypothetical protein